MEALRQFLAMGGYAAYVWPAYIIAAVVLAGLLASSFQSARKREAELAALRRARRGEEGDET
jgi:heme exporter protein D